MSNIYYEPEDFGMTLVKDHDVADSYEFDTIIVLRDSRGQHYVAHDSGCSCPLPFDHVKVPDLTPVASVAAVDAFARKTWQESYRFDGPDNADELNRHVAELVSFPWA